MAKEKYFQVRATEGDIELAKRTAKEYDISMSELLRFSLNYIAINRPPVTITIAPPEENNEDTKALPFFRDIPVGTRFRLRQWRRTLWEKTEITREGVVRYNARAVHDGRQTKIGWNAKVTIEESTAL